MNRGFIWRGVTARRDGWTPLGGEQDQGDFESKNQPRSFPDVSVQRR
jgi:hypothetical protein